MAISPEEKEHFIEFGNFLSKEERTELVEYIEAKVVKKECDLGKGSPNFEHCKESINEIFSNVQFLECCLQNPSVASQVASQIIKAFESAKRKSIMSDPYTEEEERLGQCQTLDTADFIIESGPIFEYVKENYRPEEIDVSFYRQVLDDKKTLEDEPLRAEALKESFENDWSGRLNDKQLKWEMSQIDEVRKELCSELYSKTENFEKMKEALLPFTDFMETGRMWDMSCGLWKKTDFDVLSSYAKYLQKETEIRELAEILGRLREAEDETIELEVKQTVVIQGWTTEHASKAELVGVHESDDLSALLPSEVALLSEVMTESIFFKKFAEKKLLTFDYMERVSHQYSEEISTKQSLKKPKDKGPIIISVDTSGSMSGTPEKVAKLMCFALLQIALRDKRKCYVISFSTSTATIDLSDMNNSIPRLVDFLSMSFGGGTDIEISFPSILTQLDKDGFQDADVVLISDFIAQGLSDETIARIKEAKKEKGTMFHSLIISAAANPDTLGIFDNNWAYDSSSHNAIINLVKDIRGFKKGKVR